VDLTSVSAGHDDGHNYIARSMFYFFIVKLVSAAFLSKGTWAGTTLAQNHLPTPRRRAYA
jgi:hypothetical protein